MFIPEEVSSETKIRVMRILREQLSIVGFSLKEAKDYVNSCIGEYNILPRVVTQKEVNEITKKLEPYNVGINVIKLMQQKYCTL